MYKAKKRWVVASVSALALAANGLTVSANTETVTESTTSSQPTTEAILVTESQTSQATTETSPATREAVTESSSAATTSTSPETSQTTEVSTSPEVVTTTEAQPAKAQEATISASPAVPTGNIAIVNQNNQSGSFEVNVTGVSNPDGVSEVKLAVWSETKGQDDLIWYTASQAGPDLYKAFISLSHHFNSLGQYHVHLYYVTKNRNLQGIGGTTTTVNRTATGPQGKLTVEETNASRGEFDVRVTDVYAPNGLKTVYLPIWSENAGQDDVKWYQGKLQNDGSYKVSVKASDHKNDRGLYNVHLYYQTSSGQLQGVGGVTAKVGTTQATPSTPTVAPTTGTITVINQNKTTGNFDVVISDVSHSKTIQSVVVPVWGDAQGQNDIQWYEGIRQSDGTYKVSVDIANHKSETGKYNVHLYYRDQTGLVGVGASSTTVTKETPVAVPTTGTITITNQNSSTGNFDVVISNVSHAKTIQSVVIPVWGETQGQNDIQWYEGVRQSNGTYKVSVDITKHKSETGKYNVHLYYRDQTGLVGVNTATTRVIKETAEELAAYRRQFLTSIKPASLEGAKEKVLPSIMAAQAILESNWGRSMLGASPNHNLFGIKASEDWDGPSVTVLTKEYVNGEMLEVDAKFRQYADWSASIKDHATFFRSTPERQERYSNFLASTEYKQAAEALQTAGYATDPDYAAKLIRVIEANNLMEWDSLVQHYFPKTATKGTITVTNQNTTTGNFDVIISDVSHSKTIQSVVIPVWGDSQGQNDIKWYEGSRQSDGTYKISVDIANHKLETGLYNVHLYYRDQTGLVGVGGVRTTVTATSPTAENPIVRVENHQADKGTLQVFVSETARSKPIKYVRLAAWSETNQSNLKWYQGTPSQGQLTLVVNQNQHGYKQGDYKVHLYIDYQDGTTVGNDLGAYALTAKPSVRVVDGRTYVDDILFVNKLHGLPRNYNPGEDPTAKQAFMALKAKMQSMGYSISDGYSGFRSYDHQAQVYQYYVSTHGQAQADNFSARPGFSEHQAGLAFDFRNASGTLLGSYASDAAAVNWLKHNAHNYGFIIRYLEGKEAITGYSYEPWHVRYVGARAGDIYRSGLSLEEYFGLPGGRQYRA